MIFRVQLCLWFLYEASTEVWAWVRLTDIPSTNCAWPIRWLMTLHCNWLALCLSTHVERCQAHKRSMNRWMFWFFMILDYKWKSDWYLLVQWNGWVIVSSSLASAPLLFIEILKASYWESRDLGSVFSPARQDAWSLASSESVLSHH